MTDEHLYTIEVDGTDIKEYYALEEPLDEQQVAEIWLQHIKNGSPVGPALEKSYRNHVTVEKLCKERQERQAEQRTRITAREAAEALEEAEERR